MPLPAFLIPALIGGGVVSGGAAGLWFIGKKNREVNEARTAAAQATQKAQVPPSYLSGNVMSNPALQPNSLAGMLASGIPVTSVYGTSDPAVIAALQRGYDAAGDPMIGVPKEPVAPKR